MGKIDVKTVIKTTFKIEDESLLLMLTVEKKNKMKAKTFGSLIANGFSPKSSMENVDRTEFKT
jgi:hypothetical protein